MPADPTILTAIAMVCSTIIVVAGGTVATKFLSGNKTWWSILIGAGVAISMFYVGMQLFMYGFSFGGF